MNTRMICSRHFLLFTCSMIRRRFAAHCTAVVIAACLVVAFALPGPACARFYADNGGNIAPGARFEGNNAEWYDTQLAALINTTGPNAYAPGRPGRRAFNYPDSSTPTTVWAGTNTNQVPQSYSISLWFKTDRTGGVNSNYMFLIGKKIEHMEIHTYDAGGGRGVLSDQASVVGRGKNAEAGGSTFFQGSQDF